MGNVNVNPNLNQLIIEWGNTIAGLRAVLYRNDIGEEFVQFYTGVGYNNYKRTGIWLACCETSDNKSVRLWGPPYFGATGGCTLDEDGKLIGDYRYWLLVSDPEFFNKLKKVLFRFKKRER